MKALYVSTELPSVKDLLEIASDENVVLRTSEGREFILAEIGDSDTRGIDDEKLAHKLIADISRVVYEAGRGERKQG